MEDMLEKDYFAKPVMPSGALASIADYASESDHEDFDERDRFRTEIDSDGVTKKEVAYLESSKPDFEIPVDSVVIEEDSISYVLENVTESNPQLDTSTALVSNPFAMRNIDVEYSETDDELPTLNLSGDDSDSEFDKILAYTAKERKKEHDRSLGIKASKRSKTQANTKELEREYDKLPPIENLCISVHENISMRRLGCVKHIVDCLVVIEADSGIAVDYDSIIFGEDRCALGKVFDIFGAVRCPSYSIRFNSEKEARDVTKEGKQVFVAEADKFTKKILTESLKNEKHVDGVLVLNERGEEEELFSDDEAEETSRNSGRGSKVRGRGMKRQRGRGRGHFNHSKMSWPPSQRGSGVSFNNPYAGERGPPMTSHYRYEI